MRRLKSKVALSATLTIMLLTMALTTTAFAYGDRVVSKKKVGTIKAVQDGDVYGGYMFAFNSSGHCNVYDASNYKLVGDFTRDKVKVLKPHSNSVCFSSRKYASSDPLPLLYCNVYNSYADAKDRKLGTCCVYRVTKNGKKFSSKLVQVVKIGFTNDKNLWKSDGEKRPYGNFVIDTDKNLLYAFVMRNSQKKTRFFRFKLPAVTAGTNDKKYGCKVLTLNAKDVSDKFDVGYCNCIQGCCYYAGKVLSLEGFKGSGKLKIIDLAARRVTAEYRIASLFQDQEPEMVAYRNGKFRYYDVKGNAYEFRLN